MQLSLIDRSLWAATFAEDLALISVLLFRHRVRKLPFFTALICLDVFRTVALFLIQYHGARSTYFYTYWSLALIDVLLQLGVLYRVAAQVFRPTNKWAEDTIHGFVWLIIVSVVVATVLTWIPNPPVVMVLQVALLKGNFYSALLLSELSVGIFALSVGTGLPWTAHVARVMHGFIAYLLCTLALETARTYFGVTQGSHVYDDLSHIRIAVYVVCMAYWVVTLWMDAPPTREMTDLMRQQVSAIREVLANTVEAHRTEAKP
jgi:hypothetical protein